MYRGDIYWHALPFNGQLEFFDVSLLEFAVQLTHELDIKFGLPPKRTMSQVVSCHMHCISDDHVNQQIKTNKKNQCPAHGLLRLLC